ncbi:actin depolymerizing protein [Apiospora hydei]|uniref:Actin depolymerizing protein n=1 Tax=Apiospora hydei TaxID=1337664 RepID=A0ABR1X8P5_9PEZI
MAPHEGLVHPKEYDWRDSNVELVGSDLDHKVKYASAATEPAWNEGKVGVEAGLRVWRIEDFQVVAWPRWRGEGEGEDGEEGEGEEKKVVKLGHDVFFWLGNHTSQDEAGTAAYKTVELDEFLHGTATQHRELQAEPSEEFLALFPRVTILSGGVASGFNHVDPDAEAPEAPPTLLRVFKHPYATRADSVMVYEVPPSWRSLDEDDVFVLEAQGKIWVWQGARCSPMEKAKAAQVVHDMTTAKHMDVEVVAQTESRHRAIVSMLGGDAEDGGPNDDPNITFHAPRPIFSARQKQKQEGQQQQRNMRPRRLYRLSDASGQLQLSLEKDQGPMRKSDLDSNDVFLLDDGAHVWVWQGQGASKAEKAMWIRVAQKYLHAFLRRSNGGGSGGGGEEGEEGQQQREESEEDQQACATSVAKVVEGYESPAFMRALEAGA